MAEQNPLRDDWSVSIFSKDYRNRVTQSSIRRAFSDRLLSEEDYPDERYPGYRAPPFVKSFNLGRFFTLYRVNLKRAAPLLFKEIRREYYHIKEEEYQEELKKPYHSVSGLGFSGSLFYLTDDNNYLIKSVGRYFEYSFLIKNMLEAQVEHTKKNGGKTLLSEVCDVLFCLDRRLGGILNLCPSHYVVMTNMLREKDIEKWDLKPQNFFEPIRDVVPQALQTQQAQTGLADELDTKIVLSKAQRDDLMQVLDRDTEFLKEMRTIDYSILLGRYRLDGSNNNKGPPQPERYGTGITSANGKWVYLMCIVDYLWNVDKKTAKIVKTQNAVFPEQTITTTPERYREEFMKMMEDYISVLDRLYSAAHHTSCEDNPRGFFFIKRNFHILQILISPPWILIKKKIIDYSSNGP